ncbi:xanthine dehydrogenase/oxidase-like [Maniola hyperantus]|uniref:xanthine dehydrogenase/oxidase-like n=1 Tax=Aphantopus hyperantus TaxID=2795564 RepID=UPI003747B22F
MDKVTFQVNGISHSVGCEVSSSTTLLEYLRRTLELRGTKYNCLEGGCGACIVSAAKCAGDAPRGINSCLVSVTSCQDWDIKTIEKVGNRLDGYHPLQKTLAETNGSQCGYCSPGMIMNMYSLLQSKQLTMLEIEKSLGSNICRCTGYRPILEAFKKFASDAPIPTLLDIEDLKLCDKTGQACSKEKCEQSDWCMVSRNELINEVVHIKLKDNKDWYRANTLLDVFAIWRKNGIESFMLVAGNTAKGVYPLLEYPRTLIDISCVQELQGYYLDQNLVIGGGNTLTDVISIFVTVAKNDGFSYLNILKDHINLIAHIAVSNLATLAGNLVIKNRYPNFRSDIYILLETVGAQITIIKGDGQKQMLPMQVFLNEDMKGKIILNVILPPLSSEYKIVTHKIMPRSQSVYALVQAGFLFNLDKANKVKECRIVYGGLSPKFTRAFITERYLVGKDLFTNETLQGALKVLNKELVVVENLPQPPVIYRRQVALGLLYKSLLSLCPPHILNIRYRSGAINLKDARPVSEGHQVFDTNPDLWPLNKPMPKIDGLIQCAGESKYTDDVPSLKGEVFLAFVLAKVSLGTIQKIDSSRALSEPGVIAFYSAADIPGVNSFIPAPNLYNLANEELFCDGEVKYFDQPLGVIVAKTQAIANKAATFVHVEYINIRKPILDIKLAKNDPTRTTLFWKTDATSTGNDVFKVIKGSNTIYGQYHFTMETLSCVAHPTEQGLKLYATTQWMDLIHQATSRVLKLDQNKIDIYVRRIGGGFGAKLTRSSQIAVSTALAAFKLNRPCRFNNPLNINMRAMGKRSPCSRDFEVGINAKGVIQYVYYDMYSDNGYILNEPLVLLGLDCYSNCYRRDPWKYTVYTTITDTASNTWCRAPGTLESMAMAELMIERIAYEINLDPLEVRLANLDTEHYGDILDMTETLKNNAQYAERKTAVDMFNKSNRWKKRGLRFSYMNWVASGTFNYDVNLTLYSDDGTVVITHAGVEMGQGVNTKAIQICAYLLKIPVEKIQIKPNDNVIAPNGGASGGSITTQHVAIGIRKCCIELLSRLEPIRNQMVNPTWAELAKKAFESQVDLQVHGYTTTSDAQEYTVGGVALAEVEIDVLTGEWQIIQVDLIQDVGQSFNPELDVGQIEGAFMMGVGYWTCENLMYEPKTGELLTDRTLEYWVPQARDIPQNFRIYFKKRGYSNDAIFGAKGTGEPATCLSVVIALAMRAAIASARLDSGLPTTQWFHIDGPYSVDKICTSTETRLEEFKFN